MSRRRTTTQQTTVSTDNDYINALKVLGTPEYIKGLKSDFDYLKQASSKISIASDRVTINNVVMKNGGIACTQGSINNINTDSIDSYRVTNLSINKVISHKNASHLSLSSIIPIDNNGVQIGNTNINQDNITTSNIKSNDNTPLIINDIQINNGNIKLKSLNGLNNNGVDIEDVNITNNIITTNTIKGEFANGMHVEDVYFRQNTINTEILQIDTVQERDSNKGVNIGGIKIVNGTINGVNFDTEGVVDVDTLKTSHIESKDGNLIISGNIELENAKLISKDVGFDINDVIFKDGNIYVNNIHQHSELNNEVSDVGITIGGVKLNRKEVTASNVITNLTQTNTIITENIVGGTSGVNLNGVVCKNNKLLLPSISGDDSIISMYNQSGQIVLESPDGSTYSPPTVSNWMDWVIYNNDPYMNVESNLTRFTIVEQSIWINVNVEITTKSDIPTNHKFVWMSLPENYKSTRNKFQTFCVLEDGTDIIIGKVYINGVTNNDVIYFEFNDSLQPSHTYTIYANMVYEYTYTSSINRLTPWQTWFPIRKDVQLKTIAVNNTRYYKFGSNVWLSIDVDLTMMSNFTNFKQHTYISLPPKTHAKNLYFTNPVMIESEDNVIGSISTGISSSDVKLGTNILRITNPDGFESGKKYTIKGQITFEEANTSAINFFFEQLNHNFGMLNNDNYGFMDENNTLIEFIHNVDTSTISNLSWLSYFMKDSFNIHIANDDGYSMYTQMVIIPFRSISRIENPWRVVQTDNDIKLQFTVDGSAYQDQFIISQNDEDPY